MVGEDTHKLKFVQTTDKGKFIKITKKFAVEK